MNMQAQTKPQLCTGLGQFETHKHDGQGYRSITVTVSDVSSQPETGVPSTIANKTDFSSSDAKLRPNSPQCRFRLTLP